MPTLREHWENFKAVVGLNVKNNTICGAKVAGIKRTGDYSVSIMGRNLGMYSADDNDIAALLKGPVVYVMAHDTDIIDDSARSVTWSKKQLFSDILGHRFINNGPDILAALITADVHGMYTKLQFESRLREYQDSMKGVGTRICVPRLKDQNVHIFIERLKKAGLLQASAQWPFLCLGRSQTTLRKSETNTDSESMNAEDQESNSCLSMTN